MQMSHPRFHTLERAVDRHLEWAYDYAVAGDHWSAMEALIDALAVRAELCAPAGESPELQTAEF
jgi:hypothetical protein